MTELHPVSFKKQREHLPRLSQPYVPGVRHERYWTDAEKAIVQQYYPSGGCAACLAHLGPHRTPSGVYQTAKKLGLTTEQGVVADYKGTRGKIEVPAGFDDALRKFYEEGDGRKRGECNAFADRWKLPRWWVTKRAIKLGLVMPHKKEPDWTKAEIALMSKVPLHDLDKCARIFRQHGFARSPTAIMVKAKRLDLRRRYTATFSATAVARILGVDGKTVTREIIQGDLVAVKRPSRRLPQQGGDPWSIERAELKRYIVAHLERIDLRKVDKFAFVDVLVNDGSPPAPAKSDGRKASWTPERRAAQAKRMRARWRKP
jgi:hypothetical protein